jgi:hypothetical protein
VYGDAVLGGMPVPTDLWIYVGTDGFTVARLRGGHVATVQRIDLWKAREEGRDYGEAIERALQLLRARHLAKVAAPFVTGTTAWAGSASGPFVVRASHFKTTVAA